MSALPVMPEALAHDWRNLSELIDAMASRQGVPCRNGEGVPHEWWTSDSLAERNKAARECGKCPVIAQCAAYGVAHPKEVGVYAGMTETQREQAAKAIKTQAPHKEGTGNED